jgi:hypothetical protein
VVVGVVNFDRLKDITEPAATAVLKNLEKK